MSVSNVIELQFTDDDNLKPERNFKTCPVCTSEGIDSLPVSPNEAYTYYVSESAGVSLSFTSANSRR